MEKIQKLQKFPSTHQDIREEILSVFQKYFPNVHYEKSIVSDFDYLIYFEDGQPDNYRYCLTEECGHIIYHRYTKVDYEELFKT